MSTTRWGSAGRWFGFLVLSWIVLRPALLITISLDDFVNPFFVYDKYGSNPWHLAANTTRDLFRNGHFNVVGEVFGAFVYASWNYLITWGVRYSLIYATTKFVVLIFCALVAARLLRTLASLCGREVTVWRARVLVALCLFTTLQIHVPWSLDPVGSFPLFGYLPAALGMLALDLAIAAMRRSDRRSAALAGAALCGAILYYEINVAVVVALVPVVVLLCWRRHHAGVGIGPTVLRGASIVGAPAVMTVALMALAARTNIGYTGTDVSIGGLGPRLVARTIFGSLPGAAWGAARQWLGSSFELTAVTAISAVAVGAAVLLVGYTNTSDAESPEADRSHPTVGWRGALVVASVPVIIWLAATMIQTVTTKVGDDTARLGYVYNYYAYGSVGVVLTALVLAPVVPRRDVLKLARPALLLAALAFVVAQMAVNDTVTREFDRRLAVNSALLVAYSEHHAEPQRCAALRAWVATPFFLPGYRALMVDG
ncbi:MAG: hypothetical protein ABIQ39_07670, partial [Ilumatobacteraceae bacterium]